NSAARRALARVSGGQARLVGQLGPARKGPHQGTLRARTVRAWPPPSKQAGVEGMVTAAPTCPVVRPGQPCARPVAAAIQLLRGDGSEAASGHSDADGRFRIAAPLGHYDLVVDFSGPAGKCSAPVDVTARSYTHTDVECDTGIR
ncbi:MAG: carboxypeptidase-like regulatory domain-containing protein, partial [Actinobacteria bacterium]|nr:carboxypeptidase-like regulatory domain-containing protein [Actinomycetota bacterium]